MCAARLIRWTEFQGHCSYLLRVVQVTCAWKTTLSDVNQAQVVWRHLQLAFFRVQWQGMIRRLRLVDPLLRRFLLLVLCQVVFVPHNSCSSSGCSVHGRTWPGRSEAWINNKAHSKPRHQWNLQETEQRSSIITERGWGTYVACCTFDDKRNQQASRHKKCTIFERYGHSRPTRPYFRCTRTPDGCELIAASSVCCCAILSSSVAINFFVAQA